MTRREREKVPCPRVFRVLVAFIRSFVCRRI